MLAADKCLAQMACHVYRIEDISIISWLYILLDRKQIEIVHDINGRTSGGTMAGEVRMTIILRFPHYDTWLQFQACIRGQAINHKDVYGDEEYGKPRPIKPSAPLLAPLA